MDSRVKLYLERAENQILIAKTTFEISLDNNLKGILKISPDKTFFNDVISQCYYSIFYSAKAYLLSLGILTKPPEEHKKTYEEFKKVVFSGKLDKELLNIYESESEKAEVLLNIFYLEKKKRGKFTYNINSNANIPYAEESISNARKFVSLLKNVLEKG
jgi:uncharacterized protein (UPF0332 family)